MTTRALFSSLFTSLLSLVPLLSACGDSQSAVHARQESVEALTALRSYGEDQRDAFMQELSARLALLDRQLDELKARSARATADKKADIETELGGLQTRRSSLSDQLDKLKKASKEAWNQARDATVDAFDSLADGINAAATKFGQ